MDWSFHITLTPAEGAILRIVGLIERRGYDVTAMELPYTQAIVERDLFVRVLARDSDRRVETLRNQIARLPAVHSVSYTPAGAGSASKTATQPASGHSNSEYQEHIS
jgi:acetolactate synthase regulatory subunit